MATLLSMSSSSTDLSASPTIPKSFTGLCKPFHSRVPTSIPVHCTRRPTFFIRATYVASHPNTRMLFLNAHIPQYLYPFLNTTSTSRPFEYLRLTSLGAIGALVKVVKRRCPKQTLPPDPDPGFGCPKKSLPPNADAGFGFPKKTIRPNTDAGVGCPKKTLPPNPGTSFQKIVLYLESIGLDSFAVIENHPKLITASLDDIKSTVEYIMSMDFTAIEFRRIVGMCPDVLTTHVSDIIPVFTFLLREAHVKGSDIKRVIHRRPRLLVCSVNNQLRPTLYYLQSIGIEEVSRHTDLLSCSVQEKLIPRIDYFENMGFSRRDATTMFRRFPPLFCYSIKNNLEPKYNYFVVEMGRDLKELKEFPQYFSFSLENRIKPRHKRCIEMGVCFPLPVLLKMTEMSFQSRLDVCVNSSIPLKKSPLWCNACDIQV